MRVFRHGKTNEKVQDEIKHLRALRFKHPEGVIHVGCDSQNKRRCTLYAVVIAFRYGTRGAHFIYNIERVDKMRDRYARLYREMEMSIGVADYLSENGIVVDFIDIDYNSSDRYYSNKLLSTARGWCAGLGYQTSCKPGDQPAARAADHLIN